jgi:hypothetical protein
MEILNWPISKETLSRTFGNSFRILSEMWPYEAALLQESDDRLGKTTQIDKMKLD